MILSRLTIQADYQRTAFNLMRAHCRTIRTTQMGHQPTALLSHFSFYTPESYGKHFIAPHRLPYT